MSISKGAAIAKAIVNFISSLLLCLALVTGGTAQDKGKRKDPLPPKEPAKPVERDKKDNKERDQDKRDKSREEKGGKKKPD